MKLPRDPLLHPVPLLALVLLICNDHWWKHAHPGWLTGKLSDVAGLVFFPLLLERTRLSRRAAVALTALGFAACKTLPLATDAFNESATALLQLTGIGGTSTLLTDPTDLVALPAVLFAFLLPPSPRPRVATEATHA